MKSEILISMANSLRLRVFHCRRFDDNKKPYFVTSIAPCGREGKEIILIVKSKVFAKNLSDPGYQFERLVTSKGPLKNRYGMTFQNQLVAGFLQNKQLKHISRDDCYESMRARGDESTFHSVKRMRIGPHEVSF